MAVGNNGIAKMSPTIEDDMAQFFATNDHRTIRAGLQRKEWSLGHQVVQNSGNQRSVLHNLMTNAKNGDKIVEEMLDDCVKTTHDDKNHPDYLLQVDLNQLKTRTTEGGNGNVGVGIGVIKDLIDCRNAAANKLMSHPVIETYMDIKWKTMKHIFLGNFVIYTIFLLVFSGYLYNIFHRTVTHRITFGDVISDHLSIQEQVIFPNDPSSNTNRINLEFELPEEVKQKVMENAAAARAKKNKTWTIKPAFRSCTKLQKKGIECASEMSLTVLLALLAIQELMQMAAFGIRHYVNEFENFVELIVILLAAATLATQHVENVVKWFGAFGIVFAYIELVFLLGRYPPLGGRISIMFYNITRHLLRSLSNMIVLVFGFAFGLFIMHHRTENESFQNPLKAIVKTLILVLGEYELDAFHATEFPDRYSYIFSIVLLILLAIVGSLVMVNLFVAIIVSDIDDLKKSGQIQEIVIKAQHIVYYKAVQQFLRKCVRPRIGAGADSGGGNNVTSNIVKICPHSICNEGSCQGMKMDDNLSKRLQSIVKKRNIAGGMSRSPALATTDQNILHDLLGDLIKS